MDSTYIEKEVYFDRYCKTCVHANKKEEEEPCCDCLEEPVNEYSHKPVRYKEEVDKNGTRKNEG